MRKRCDAPPGCVDAARAGIGAAATNPGDDGDGDTRDARREGAVERHPPGCAKSGCTETSRPHGSSVEHRSDRASDAAQASAAHFAECLAARIPEAAEGKEGERT